MSIVYFIVINLVGVIAIKKINIVNSNTFRKNISFNIFSIVYFIVLAYIYSTFFLEVKINSLKDVILMISFYLLFVWPQLYNEIFDKESEGKVSPYAYATILKVQFAAFLILLINNFLTKTPNSEAESLKFLAYFYYIFIMAAAIISSYLFILIRKRFK